MARILIVEDNAASLTLMSYLLTAAGHTLEGCRDGQSGLEAVRRQRPDLVLCDIQLPRLSGHELAQALRADPAFRDLPLVAVTAQAMRGDSDKALAAGFNGYIAKPLEPETFARQVETFLRPDPAAVGLPRQTPGRWGATVADPSQPVRAPPMSVNSSKSVLVIDDDEFVRGVVTRQLQELGSRVTTACDGVTAREALRRLGPFDIVVSDLKMPGADGVELLRDFAELQPSAGLVLMSSVDAKTMGAVEQLARARELRFLGSLPKPISSVTLKSLLERFDREEPPTVHRKAPVEISADALRAAIAAEEIDVYIQPKVDLASGQLAGAEALARWIKPDGTVVAPAAFIGVAERAGLMDDLTDLVVRQALAACGRWQAQGLRTSIAINIPIASLDRLDLPDRIEAEAKRHGLKPDRIILEVTETGLLHDLARSLDVVTRLRLRGFRLAVDDFGVGYSSLERLKDFPFTELKLDRAFVDGAARDTGLRSIAESSIRLAHSLHLSTCAEGVETRADLDVMRALGCELVQGYFLCRPMPKGDLPAWVAAQAGQLSR